jgi:hypothetical protein
MYRLLFILFLLFGLKGHAIENGNCDWTGVPIDSEDCVDFSWYKKADIMKCTNMPKCFKLQYEEISKEKPKKKEFFAKEDAEEKKKIIPILDNSAIALLKNSSLKNIKIIFYNKSGKLSKDFAKEAEQYILDKGVKRDQFIIEIR